MSLQRYLNVLPRILMVVTSEEDRLVEDIVTSVRKTCDVKVWNPAFGLTDGNKYLEEWSIAVHPEDPKSVQLNSVLVEAYKNLTSSEHDNLYYVILDADNYLRDPLVIRRLKNIAISGHRNEAAKRTIILVSNRGSVPADLAPYVEVYDYENPSDEIIADALASFEEKTRAAGEHSEVPEKLKSRLSTFTLPDKLVEAARGLTVFQIEEILNWLIAEKNFKVTLGDFRERRRRVLERSELIDFVETDVTFDDLAGVGRLKTWLGDVGRAWTEKGREWGVPSCRGVLLVGVPGCGKSLTSKCLATEWDLPLVHFDPGRLFSSRVGESEANMRKALRSLESLSPCVVWIDEIEKGFSGIHSSSHTDSGTTARVIGTFLSWFQEHRSEVFLVATANGVSTLPPELISRFEEIFFVDLPGFEARRVCFDIHLRKYWKPNMGEMGELDLDILARESDGMTGREIDKVVREGLRKSFSATPRGVTTEHLRGVLRSKSPISKVMKDEIDSLLNWVSFDPERGEGVRARLADEPADRNFEGLIATELGPDDKLN